VVASTKPAFYALLAQRPTVALPPAPGELCREKSASHVFISPLTSGSNELGLAALKNYREALVEPVQMVGSGGKNRAIVARLDCNRLPSP